jgi:wyosine [tRNA(Phe)-imidazoG37] synthetase (radical SAM superfamily)
MLLALQKNIVYGPVNSRRLGRSLGINILPAGKKICTFNCLYCQYGWTDYDMVKNVQKEDFPGTEMIISSVEEALAGLGEPPAYLTFSGNGEATIHPDFPEIVDGLIKLRNRTAPGSKTAILSNSTLADNENVRKALAKLDARIMKLDAGSQAVFASYNDPMDDIILDSITDALMLLKDVTIQSLFTGGLLGNYSQSTVDDWIAKIKKIKPVSVQIYTLDRGTPSLSISRLDTADLNKIKLLLDKENIKSEVF